jgi:hypothetical protein
VLCLSQGWSDHVVVEALSVLLSWCAALQAAGAEVRCIGGLLFRESCFMQRQLVDVYTGFHQ